MTRFLMVLGLLCAALAPGASAQAQGPQGLRTPEALFVFGDSISDTGNDWTLTKLLRATPTVPPSETPYRSYDNGRFSNGPVAFEYLWWKLRGLPAGSSNELTPFLRAPYIRQKGAVNFSFGGSVTGLVGRTPGGFLVPGLRAQVEMFRVALGNRKPPKRALYAIVTGANDYLTTPPEVPADPADVVANIRAAIEVLHSAGGRDMLVVNLLDLGLLPIVAGTPASALLTDRTVQHNALLSEMLGDLAARLSGIRIIPVDLSAVFAQLPAGTDIIHPAIDTLFPPPAPGQVSASRCLFVDARTCRDVPTFDVSPAFFFWDAVHPTTATHRLLGEYMYAVLQQLQ